MTETGETRSGDGDVVSEMVGCPACGGYHADMRFTQVPLCGNWSVGICPTTGTLVFERPCEKGE